MISCQAEYGCHEPDCQLRATTTTTTAVKRAKAKRSGAGAERGSREGSSFWTLFQVS